MQTIENHLTPRLEMILSLVPKSSSVCDIGTDHGYIPIALYKKGLAENVIAMDIKEGPLSQAQKNIDAFSLSSKIEKINEVNIKYNCRQLCNLKILFYFFVKDYRYIKQLYSSL